jgi:hypothetical protein
MREAAIMAATRSVSSGRPDDDADDDADDESVAMDPCDVLS